MSKVFPGGIHDKLMAIQQNLDAPKDKRNNFGGYNYRSCEGILAALKPLLMEHGCTITLSDHIQESAGRVHVVATATLSDGVDSVSVTAAACEAASKKGMDEAQITGAASSYARKYALNGMFAIDDVADPDATNKHGKDEVNGKKYNSEFYKAVKDDFDKCDTVAELDDAAKALAPRANTGEDETYLKTMYLKYKAAIKDEESTAQAAKNAN